MVRAPHPRGDGGDRTPPLSPCSPAEWISVDKDETTASKGKVPLGARATQDNAKYGGQGSAGWGAWLLLRVSLWVGLWDVTGDTQGRGGALSL